MDFNVLSTQCLWRNGQTFGAIPYGAMYLHSVSTQCLRRNVLRKQFPAGAMHLHSVGAQSVQCLRRNLLCGNVPTQCRYAMPAAPISSIPCRSRDRWISMDFNGFYSTISRFPDFRFPISDFRPPISVLRFPKKLTADN